MGYSRICLRGDSQAAPIREKSGMRVESSGSENALTDQYGLITDYLAEAFHYQLKHSNLR
jgi:hypothetical protein